MTGSGGKARRGPKPPRAPRLFGSREWPRFESLLRRADRPLLIVFDVDGTLAPIVRRPERARIPAATLRLLEAAVGARNVAVAVLSARTRRELGRMVPVRGVRKIAQYGIGSVAAEPKARLRRWRRSAGMIARRLSEAAGDRRSAPPGTAARVEPKGITVALHDRGVTPAAMKALRRAVRSITNEAESLGFEPVLGSRVTEFIPRGHGKATALRALLRERPAAGTRTVFYWGDSEADEPAFGALGRKHVSVKVGPGPTQAAYRVDGPRDAARFLASVVKYRRRGTKTRGHRNEPRGT